MPYERYEFTRLSQIRAHMDLHKTYKKEGLGLDDDDEIIRDSDRSDGGGKTGKQKDSFIWTFFIRPVHEENTKK